MKYYLTAFIFISFQFINAQSIITGKIDNYDRISAVYFSTPHDGIALVLGTFSEINPKPNGTFKIKIENQGLSQLNLSFLGLKFKFLLDDDSDIQFTLDQNKIPQIKSKSIHSRDSVKLLATISITGDFSQVNNYYSSSAITSFGPARTVEENPLSWLLNKTDSPTQALVTLDSLVRIELAKIDMLPNNIGQELDNRNLIGNNVIEFLKNEVRAFYASIFLNAMDLRRKSQAIQLTVNPRAPLIIYNSDWENLTEDIFNDLVHITEPAPNSHRYNELIMAIAHAKTNYKKYGFEEARPSFDQIILQELFETQNLVPDSALLSSKVKFAYQLNQLQRFANNQMYYSPLLLGAVEEMKIAHPNSKHLAELEPQIEKLKNYIKAGTENFKDAKIIRTNFLSFDDLLENFKGQNLLIDVWATWCGPCIEDFNHKSILDPYVQNGDIELLYISIDKDEWKQRWRDNIKFNHLAGHHVLANDILINDMWSTIEGYQGAIPRMVLVDKKGNIFKATAARLSEGGQLKKQIEELIGAN